MALGPLDKRVVRTRCQACAKRRIKCEGGRPCAYCAKKEIECSPQPAKRQGLVFVNHAVTLSDVVPSQTQPLALSRVYTRDGSSDQFINHFFTSFIARNGFGVDIDLTTIISQFQHSSSLYHVSVAVGALDLSMQNPSKKSTFHALQSYRASVTNFQSELQRPGFLQSDDGLWTTFFLGLFELMFDVSGEGWVKHILYGTSKIIQLRGPQACTIGPARSFFVTVRAFEISRSLIYSESSFLCEEPWRAQMRTMWDGEFIREWHPKEELFDLMLDCCALSQEVQIVLEQLVTRSGIENESALRKTAASGNHIRHHLATWFQNFQTWSRQEDSAERHISSTLALIYYHAISIFLSGLFDYHSEFDEAFAPTLSTDIIQSHVQSILSEASGALYATNLAGVLLFFPLRVAGARSKSMEQQTMILGMLREIQKRSFVVAGAFILDLQNLWSHRMLL